jgi:hypothetical protein
MTLLIASLFLILFEAIHEGLALKGHKTIAGVIEGFYLVVVSTIVLLWVAGIVVFGISAIPFIRIIAGFVLLRFAVFDIVFNAFAGLPLFFIGTTKLIDKFWQWFFGITKFPVTHFFFMVKLIALCIGLSFLLGK